MPLISGHPIPGGRFCVPALSRTGSQPPGGPVSLPERLPAVTPKVFATLTADALLATPLSGVEDETEERERCTGPAGDELTIRERGGSGAPAWARRAVDQPTLTQQSRAPLADHRGPRAIRKLIQLQT